MIYSIDISKMDDEERCAVLALQGLANRGDVNIWIEPKETGGFSGKGYQNMSCNKVQDGTDPISKARRKYSSLEDVWTEFYTERYGYDFKVVEFDQLFKQFSNLIKGIVVYERLDADAGIPVAATICGVEDAIPVTNSLLMRYQELKNFKVLENLMEHHFKNKLDTYRWLIYKYLDKCSTKGAYSYWKKQHNYFTLDYAVSNKMFSFSLKFDNEVYYDNKDFDREESALIGKIFDYLDFGSSIYGWSRSSEPVMQGRVGMGGHVLICTNASPNLSFHANVRRPLVPLRQKHRTHNFPLENKIYLTFTSNEGDTYKCVGNLINDGSWLHDNRGEIPFNWAINPQLLARLPGLADYYYTTCTEQDYFISPTTGFGYFDATNISEEMREKFAGINKKYFEFADLHYLDIWWNNFSTRDDWIKSMGIDGFTTWDPFEKVSYNTSVMNIGSDMYYDLYCPYLNHGPARLAAYLKNRAGLPELENKPWFIHIYASDPSYAYRTMQILPDNRFKAVCMDEFFDLAHKAQSKIDGIKLVKDTELIKDLKKNED